MMTETELQTSKQNCGTGMEKKSMYRVAVGCRKISSSMMAFTAPLRSFYETEENRVTEFFKLFSVAPTNTR